jgi:hypothetical protein
MPATTRKSPATTPKRVVPISNEEAIRRGQKVHDDMKMKQAAAAADSLLPSQSTLPVPPSRVPTQYANRRKPVDSSVEQFTPTGKTKTPTRPPTKKNDGPLLAVPPSRPPFRHPNGRKLVEEETPSSSKTKTPTRLPTKKKAEPLLTTPVRSSPRLRRKTPAPTEVEPNDEKMMAAADESIASRVKAKRNEMSPMVKESNKKNSVLSHLPRAPVFNLPPLTTSESRLKRGEPLVLPRPPSSHAAVPTAASIVEADPVPSSNISSPEKSNASSSFSWLLQLVSLYFLLVMIVYFFHYNSISTTDSMNEPCVSLDACFSLNASTMGLSNVTAEPMLTDEL